MYSTTNAGTAITASAGAMNTIIGASAALLQELVRRPPPPAQMLQSQQGQR